MTRLDRWPDALKDAFAGCRVFSEAVVLAETGSTQDLARERAQDCGLVVTTWRQTRGRGRLGRSWADTEEAGLAATFVVADASSELLAMACAVATAATAESFLARSVGIKWPNDVVVDRRKLAGVLIERVGGSALLGIGINVRQRTFAAELAETATSLALLGSDADRCDVLVRLVRELDRCLLASDEGLRADYARRDALSGSVATLGTPDGDVTGEVREADPAAGVLIRVQGVDRRLPAATTTVKAWESRSR